MAERHLVQCGCPRPMPRHPAWRRARAVRLQNQRPERNLHLKVHHLTRAVGRRLGPEALDLLDIAAYVYAGDQACRRGGTVEFEYGEVWRRDFRFEIPVRRPELWSRSDVRSCLQATLGFLSDDDYEFVFRSHTHPPPADQYLTDDVKEDDGGYEEVMLFSGGLDSFGGAVQEILVGGRKVVLVSHRPVNKLHARQTALVADLCGEVADKSKVPLHVSVEINKSKRLGREFSQRSRSFLFAALAAVVARAMGRDRIRFYENGIISLNFPISPQVIGARATRTTHPQVLNGFADLFTLVFDCPVCCRKPVSLEDKGGRPEADQGRERGTPVCRNE